MTSLHFHWSVNWSRKALFSLYFIDIAPLGINVKNHLKRVKIFQPYLAVFLFPSAAASITSFRGTLRSGAVLGPMEILLLTVCACLSVCECACLCTRLLSSLSLRRWSSSCWPGARCACRVEPTKANQPTLEVCRFRPSLHFSLPIRSKSRLRRGSAHCGMKLCRTVWERERG